MRAYSYCLWIVYTFSIHPFKLFQHFKYRRLLLKLVNICLCCKLDQQATATFGFKKDGGQSITNYCSEISKREGTNSIISPWKAADGQKEWLKIWQCVKDANFMTLEIYHITELGAVIDRNKDTRCIAICIAIRVFHIAIHFLAYWCTPTNLTFFILKVLKAMFIQIRQLKWLSHMDLCIFRTWFVYKSYYAPISYNGLLQNLIKAEFTKETLGCKG